MKTLITVTLALFAAISFASLHQNTSFQDVKSGDKDLYCHIGKDYKWIDPALVIGYDDHSGWRFTNGNAKNCRVTVRS